jgi:hypothetical protein
MHAHTERMAETSENGLGGCMSPFAASARRLRAEHAAVLLHSAAAQVRCRGSGVCVLVTMCIIDDDDVVLTWRGGYCCWVTGWAGSHLASSIPPEGAPCQALLTLYGIVMLRMPPS